MRRLLLICPTCLGARDSLGERACSNARPLCRLPVCLAACFRSLIGIDAYGTRASRLCATRCAMCRRWRRCCARRTATRPACFGRGRDAAGHPESACVSGRRGVAGYASFIYFAGHGLAEETAAEDGGPQGLLLPQDASRDDPATLLPMVEIEGLLSRLPCQHLLLLLDCCFAGAFRWSKTRSITPGAASCIASASSATCAILPGRSSPRPPPMSAPWICCSAPGWGTWCRGRKLPVCGGAVSRAARAADLRIDGQPGDGVIIGSELHYLETAFERLEQQVGRTMQKPPCGRKKERDKGQFVFLTPRPLAEPADRAGTERAITIRIAALASYGEEHRMLFFGRSAVADALTATQVEGHELGPGRGLRNRQVEPGARGLFAATASQVDTGLAHRAAGPPGYDTAGHAAVPGGLLCPGSSTLSAAVAGFCQAPAWHADLPVHRSGGRGGVASGERACGVPCGAGRRRGRPGRAATHRADAAIRL